MIISFQVINKMEELFEKLSTYKGQELKCKYLSGNKIIPLEGILKDVDYYKGITLGAVILPFIAMASGIIEIRTLDDEILYLNENMEMMIMKIMIVQKIV